MSDEELRKLNAEVAAKLFGLTGIGYYGPTKSGGMHTDNQRYDTPEEALEAYKRFWPATPKRHGHATWEDVEPISLCSWKDGWGPVVVDEYSEWMHDAWHVVVKMRADGWHFSLQDFGDAWECQFHKEPPGVTTCANVVTAETPELAICRGALKAREVTQ